MEFSLKYTESSALDADIDITVRKNTDIVQDGFGNVLFDTDDLLGEYSTNFANPCEPYLSVLDNFSLQLYSNTHPYLGVWLKKGATLDIRFLKTEDGVTGMAVVYSSALQIEFEKAINNYPQTFEVSFVHYDAESGESVTTSYRVATKTYIDTKYRGKVFSGIAVNDGYAMNIQVPRDEWERGYHSISITFDGENIIPDTLTRISSFRPWAEFDIPEESISSNSFVDEISLLSIECPASTLDLKLINVNGVIQEGGAIEVVTDYEGIHNPVMYVKSVSEGNDGSISVSASNYVSQLDNKTLLEVASDDTRPNLRRWATLGGAFDFHSLVIWMDIDNVFIDKDGNVDRDNFTDIQTNPLLWGHMEVTKTQREVLQAAMFATGTYIHHCDGKTIYIYTAPDSKNSEPTYTFALSEILQNTLKNTHGKPKFGTIVSHTAYWSENGGVYETFTTTKKYYLGETINVGVPCCLRTLGTGVEKSLTNISAFTVTDESGLDSGKSLKYIPLSTETISATVNTTGNATITEIVAPFAPLSSTSGTVENIKRNNIAIDKLAKRSYNYLQKAQYSATVVEPDGAPLELGKTYALHDTESTIVSGILTKQKYSFDGGKVFKEIELHDF